MAPDEVADLRREVGEVKGDMKVVRRDIACVRNENREGHSDMKAQLGELTRAVRAIEQTNHNEVVVDAYRRSLRRRAAAGFGYLVAGGGLAVAVIQTWPL